MREPWEPYEETGETVAFGEPRVPGESGRPGRSVEPGEPGELTLPEEPEETVAGPTPSRRAGIRFLVSGRDVAHRCRLRGSGRDIHGQPRSECVRDALGHTHGDDGGRPDNGAGVGNAVHDAAQGHDSGIDGPADGARVKKGTVIDITRVFGCG
ncbi:hypothetical protein [Streptodolium elevatio]|uniref:Uncharacterized protein n=1 Tax=Streptodolium elevatio TaxID=3157996 RepID=A0ABV3DF65_9ACTN